MTDTLHRYDVGLHIVQEATQLLWLRAEQPISIYSLQGSGQACSWRVNTERHPVVTRDLAEAREDLQNVFREADEEAYPRPSQIAFGSAVMLLTTMYEVAAQRFDVYPTPDAEIAIEASPRPGMSLIALCDSAGGVLFLRYVDGAQMRRRFGSVHEITHEIQRALLSDASA